MLVLAFLGALLLASTATSTTLTPFTYELSAADPVIKFEPIGPRTEDMTDKNSTEDNTPSGANSVPPEMGWELSYSGVPIPLASITKDTIPVGTPKRTSAFPGATIDLRFFGTGVVVWGNCSETKSGVVGSINDRSAAVVGTGGVLVNLTDMPFFSYTLTLRLESGSMEFHSATIYTLMKTDGWGLMALGTRLKPSITAKKANITTVPAIIGTDKKLNPVFHSDSGRWDELWEWAGTVWNRVAAPLRGALTYSVPVNTSFIVVYGGTSATSGDYRVTFTPQPWNGQGHKDNNWRSQYSLWPGKDVILWAGPLDPATKYDMEFQAMLMYWWVELSHVRLWSSLEGTGAANEEDVGPDKKIERKGSSNIGAIAGGAACGIAAVVAIALLIFFLRRRKSRDESSKPQPLDLSEGDMHEYQPHSVLGHNSDTPPVGEQHSLLTPFPAAPEAAASEGASASASASPSGDGDDTPQLPMSAKHGFAPRPKVGRQDTDAGAVATSQVTDAGEDVDMVPPSYDPQWAPAESGSRA